MQLYRHAIAAFYLKSQKDKMVHKRTPYTLDAFLESVKILTAFNASGDVLILIHASFHLPGGLMPCVIITSFVYFELSNDLLLDWQWAIESDDSVTIDVANYANTNLHTRERVNVLPKQ